MAKVAKNIIIEGLSGMLGNQLVFRVRDGKTIIAVKPHFAKDREFSDKQKEQQEKFRGAIEYASGAQGEEIYKEKAGEKALTSAFNVAVADFLHPPEIRDIDLEGYNGKAGDIVKIRAIDDVKVKEVGVVLMTEKQELIEQGKAVQSADDPVLWEYTATKDAPKGKVKIVADAADLPGHIVKEEAEK